MSLEASVPTETFKYTPVDTSTPTFRLVQILPDLTLTGHMQCRIKHALIEDIRYQCLSYEWGTDQGSGQIILNDGLINIRANLMAFLEWNRKRLHSTNLWVDALCIDQGNPNERSYQVRRMDSIYANARRMLVWLGTDAETADMLSGSLTWSTPRGTSSGYEFRSRELNNLIHLSQNSYWSRAWITQEVLLARRLLLMAQGAAMDERYLPDSVRFGLTHLIEMRRQNNLLTKNLLALLYEFRSQECHIRRDIVYSLLSLCREGQHVDVDYTTSDSSVIRSVLKACQQHLCLCSAPIVAEAMGVGTLPMAVIVFRAEYDFLGDNTQSTCSHCGSRITHGSGSFAYAVCLRRLCAASSYHLLWSDSNEPKARVSFTNEHCFLHVGFRLRPRETSGGGKGIRESLRYASRNASGYKYLGGRSISAREGHILMG